MRSTFAVRETASLGIMGAPLRVDSALRALSTLRGLRGAPEVPPLCRETQSLGQQMLNAPFGINGLTWETIASAIQETSVSRYHGGPIKSTSKPLRQSQHYRIKGALNCRPIM